MAPKTPYGFNKADSEGSKTSAVTQPEKTSGSKTQNDMLNLVADKTANSKSSDGKNTGLSNTSTSVTEVPSNPQSSNEWHSQKSFPYTWEDYMRAMEDTDEYRRREKIEKIGKAAYDFMKNTTGIDYSEVASGTKTPAQINQALSKATDFARTAEDKRALVEANSILLGYKTTNDYFKLYGLGSGFGDANKVDTSKVHLSGNTPGYIYYKKNSAKQMENAGKDTRGIDLWPGNKSRDEVLELLDDSSRQSDPGSIIELLGGKAPKEGKYGKTGPGELLPTAYYNFFMTNGSKYGTALQAVTTSLQKYNLYDDPATGNSKEPLFGKVNSTAPQSKNEYIERVSLLKVELNAASRALSAMEKPNDLANNVIDGLKRSIDGLNQWYNNHAFNNIGVVIPNTKASVEAKDKATKANASVKSNQTT